MFIGHFGIGFGAKALAPRTSLGSLFLAALFIDLLWSLLLLAGVERVWIIPGATEVTPLNFEYFPYSHSLLAVIVWGVLVAGVYLGIRGYVRGAVVMGLVVVSHWFLDCIVHAADLPLLFDGKKVGLDLWSSKAGTLFVEMMLFLVGVGIFFNNTVPKDGNGDSRLGSLLVVLLCSYFAILFGPPPPSTAAIAWMGMAQWLFIVWGYWVDRNRISVKAQ